MQPFGQKWLPYTHQLLGIPMLFISRNSSDVSLSGIGVFRNFWLTENYMWISALWLTSLFLIQKCPFTPMLLKTWNVIRKHYLLQLIKWSKENHQSFILQASHVINSCLERSLLPLITKIVNLSLESAIMPNGLKMALLTPLLKKSSLDHEEFKNFRPISNLKFVSKVIEKVVAAQVNNYLSDNNLHEPFQSAYTYLLIR